MHAPHAPNTHPPLGLPPLTRPHVLVSSPTPTQKCSAQTGVQIWQVDGLTEALIEKETIDYDELAQMTEDHINSKALQAA